MFYTKSAALRLIPAAKTIEAIRIIRNTVQVTYRTAYGRCSTFLSKKAFKRDFVEVRKAAGRLMVSHQLNAIKYDVYNLETETTHTVTLLDSGLHCDCIDYDRQIKTIGRGCCKHGYAILQQWLGCGSLAEYVTQREAIAA